MVARFEELQVWQKARALSVEIYRVSEGGRFSKDFGLRDQIRRAAVSVMSNLAEGFERFSPAEFLRFLSIARGSVAEVRSQLYLAADLEYISEDQLEALSARCVEITRMLTSMRNSVRR